MLVLVSSARGTILSASGLLLSVGILCGLMRKNTQIRKVQHRNRPKRCHMNESLPARDDDDTSLPHVLGTVTFFVLHITHEVCKELPCRGRQQSYKSIQHSPNGPHPSPPVKSLIGLCPPHARSLFILSLPSPCWVPLCCNQSSLSHPPNTFPPCRVYPSSLPIT